MRLGMMLYRVLEIYSWLIFVEVLLSWFVASGNGLVQDVYGALQRIVEPFVGLFRRFFPPMMGLDFSPWAAMIAVQLLQRLVLQVFIY